jgi:hypothetical protein
MSWIQTYTQEYMPLLQRGSSGAKRGLIDGYGQRGSGFQLIFEILLEHKRSNFHIIETGTLRRPGNWKDGQSSRLFSEFVDHYGGSVRSVDRDPVAVTTSRSQISSTRFSVTCQDSVEFLASLKDLDQVDLFYLDSWDVKWQDDTPSASHHLREFLAIEPFLSPGCLVAIDDNSRLLGTNRRVGKGRAIVEYLQEKNKDPIYDQYQIIFQF